MAQAPEQTQTQQAPPAPAKPKPRRAPLPEIPPEFDALPIWKSEPAKLVAMVKDPKATVFQKAIACKKLSITGGPDAVAPMAALLSHPQLACYARFGMEPNPSPAVDDAFRAALPKLTGKLKVGVINSIGVRKDAKALDALSKLIDDPDTMVAQSAAASTAMIGGLQAAKTLEGALGRTKVPVFPVVARACLLCAEHLMPAHKTRALELYSKLSAENMPGPVRMAAMRVLNAAGPAPAGAPEYPPPTGEAAKRDKSGFLGRDQ